MGKLEIDSGKKKKNGAADDGRWVMSGWLAYRSTLICIRAEQSRADEMR